MSESKTPRTDEHIKSKNLYPWLCKANFARTLELELNEARKRLIQFVDSPEGKNFNAALQRDTANRLADELQAQLTTAQQEIAELKKLVTQHREGVARFLVPWRGRLDKSWLDHFVKECGVEFDAIGFVKATPLTDSAMKGPNSK